LTKSLTQQTYHTVHYISHW